MKMQFLKSHNSSIYIKLFCGEDEFIIWSESHHNFGLCFQKSVLCGISFALLAIFSAFYIGKQTSLFIRNKTQKTIIFLRIFVSLVSLLLAVLYPFLLYYYSHAEVFWVDIFTSLVQIFTWIVHIGYLNSLRYYLTRGTRGPRPVIAAWISTLICNICYSKTIWSIQTTHAVPLDNTDNGSALYLQRCLFTTQLAFQVVYLLTLFPHGRCDFPPSREYSRVDENTPLLRSPFPRFREVFDPYHLGVAEDGVNWLSYITFHWVNLMMEKGYHRLLESIDDLYDLPYPLRSEVVSQRVQKQMMLSHPLSTSENEEVKMPKYLLLKALNKCFGARFYAVGILKLISDSLGFAGPLLLNVLVKYVEGDSTMTPWMGYGAGVGLCVANLISAFCIVHFNYQMAKVTIQMRASLITTVYRKTQQLNLANLSKFSTGEIVNLMSTDTDRVINFCQSFHAFWSLPLQFCVTLYLLYLQIGLAFLAGVLIAVLLIPLNRFLAVKIGQLSTRMMHFKDRRLNLMTDILTRIKEVKLNSWESLFKNKVMDERFGEVRALAGRKYLDAACVYFWASTPVLIPIFTFGVYAFLGNAMEPAKVFTAVALFNMLITPLNAFPWVINGLIEAWVSMKRIERLLQMKDYSYNEYYTVIPEGGYQRADVQVVLLDANFAWSTNNILRKNSRQSIASSNVLQELGAEAAPSQVVQDCSHNDVALTLKGIDITLSKSQTIAIVGNVGGGKTALLYAILGELEKISGVISVSGLHQGFGLATQRPWLQNVTIKENILFGQNFDPSRYRSVLHSCALEEDLKVFPLGDETKCGDNGTALSGGQRSRVALARAVYQIRNIYLLDDVLSGVDAAVAKQIIDRCIHGLLVGKTVVLVTHHIHLLSRFHMIIQIEDGVVKRQGAPNTLLPIIKKEEIQAEWDPSPQSSSGAVPKVPLSSKSDWAKSEENEPSPSRENVTNTDSDIAEVEGRSFGELNSSVFTTYFSACGVSVAVLIFFSLVLMQASRNLVDTWLAKWVSHYVAPSNGTLPSLLKDGDLTSNIEVRPMWYSLNSFPTMFTSLTTLPDQQMADDSLWQVAESMDPTTKSYLIVYIVLAITNTLFTLARAFLFAYGGICAAKSLHKKLFDSVIYAKIGFFDLNPVGRILNRFSTDVYAVDDTLPFQANIFFAQIFGLLGALIITIYGLPWIILLYIPLMFMYYTIQEYYRHSSRDLRRIYALSLSPLYTHFTDTMQGLPVIRAFRTSHRFGLLTDTYLEQNQRAQFGLQITAQWLNLRLQLLGIGILGGVVFLGLWQHHIKGISPGLIGLVISYALTINGFLNGVVTYLTETERELISVERVHQYLEGTSREGQNGINANLLAEFCPTMVPTPVALPIGWPHQGQIVFENVHLKYHDHNPYSLRNVTFIINPAEKVGLVGRTGAGKSSIFTALFRLVELSRGKIFIDNVDISDINIKKLRTSMAIVTQDVLLFNGTIRENLDPKCENLDREILHAVERCNLTPLVEARGGLDATLKGGQELSAGERQLFCLARAFLSSTKIVCLDEGTAQLDPETDSQIQRVVKDTFRNKTVLVSSHRMRSFRGCQRVIVLNDGEVAEIGNPSTLIEDKNSLFYSIINSH